MKFLKISSLLVLSLLLFVPAALADVECELRPNSQRVRMESEMEMLAALTLRCESEAGNLDSTTDGEGGLVLVDSDITADGDARSTFDLELVFSGDVINDEDTGMPTLWIVDVADATAARTVPDPNPGGLSATDADGNRMPAPMARVGSDSVYWEGIRFPESWAGETRGTLDIAMIYMDASSIDGERLEATLDMAGMNLNGDEVLTAEAGPVTVARVDQALNLSFAEDNKAAKFNACEPGSATISVTLEEGYRMAWDPMNDILLKTSSGKISASDTGIFDVTGEGDADEIIIDVSSTDADDSGDIAIKFEPAAGGTVGDDITLSAMILPMRRSMESFGYSAQLVVGTYSACEGDKLFFPFVTSMSGWDTGIVVSNNSKVDGSCYLNWGDMDLDDDEMEALSTVDVDAKDHMTFLVSAQRGADYNGSLGVQCSFSSATGYVFLSDVANSIGQGYLVKP